MIMSDRERAQRNDDRSLTTALFIKLADALGKPTDAFFVEQEGGKL